MRLALLRWRAEKDDDGRPFSWSVWASSWARAPATTTRRVCWLAPSDVPPRGCCGVFSSFLSGLVGAPSIVVGGHVNDVHHWVRK